MTGATQKLPTMCPMNCHPTLCGMVAEIEDKKLVKISGNKDHPDSRGFLCAVSYTHLTLPTIYSV